MKIKLFWIGKTASSFIQEGIATYQKRIPHYFTFTIDTLPDIKNAGKMPAAELKKKEGEAILKKLDNRDFLVLLDENGKTPNSRQFAIQLEQWGVQGVESVVFLIGGAFGFSDAIYERANFKLSLSKMTFSHQLIRLIFLEQLYRAGTIIKGESYHND